MQIATDLGRRVELVSMDAYLAEISIGLYRKETPDGPVAVVHSYARVPGTAERLTFVASAMTALGGLEPTGDDARTIRFSCRSWHHAAAKRLFLEACKLDPAVPVEPPALERADPRSDQTIRVASLGGGAFRVEAEGATDETPSRAPAVAAALAKLAELMPGAEPTVVAFPCGADHGLLLGALLKRALDLRASLREEELKASRGVLAAPSAQE